MKTFLRLLIVANAVLTLGCQSLPSSTPAAPKIEQARVEGTSLNYLEQGEGVTVVFVHGAFSDHRIWEAQRVAVAKGHRYIALDQRYFGAAPWPDNGTKYSVATHANDLAVFIQQLNAGPVHVVGWSYGGTVALVLAAQRPDLIRSLFVYEPALGSIVSDSADQRILADERKSIGPVVAASKAKDQARAVRLFVDWVNDQLGGFDAVPRPMREVLLENSRTLPAHFASPSPPPVTCSQLGEIKVPVTVAMGQQSRPFFKILAEATHRCIPGSSLNVILSARHTAPIQNTQAFNAALLAHLDGR